MGFSPPLNQCFPSWTPGSALLHDLIVYVSLVALLNEFWQADRDLPQQAPRASQAQHSFPNQFYSGAIFVMPFKPLVIYNGLGHVGPIKKNNLGLP